MPNRNHLTVVKSPQGRPLDPALDDAIVDAVFGLLAEVGFDRLSVEHVAKRAGTVKSSVYRRWSNKFELVKAALQSDRFREALWCDQDTGSLRGDLRATLPNMAAAMTDAVHVMTGLFTAMRSNPGLSELVRVEVIDSAHESMHAIMIRAAERGEISSGAAASLLLRQLAVSMMFSHLLVVSPAIDGRWVDDLIDTVIVPSLTHDN